VWRAEPYKVVTTIIGRAEDRILGGEDREGILDPSAPDLGGVGADQDHALIPSFESHAHGVVHSGAQGAASLGNGFPAEPGKPAEIGARGRIGPKDLSRPLAEAAGYVLQKSQIERTRPS